MRLSYFTACLALVLPAVQAISPPDNALQRRDEHAVSVRSAGILSPEHALVRRKGGGGRGGGGGGSSSSSSGGRSGGSSSGGSSGRTAPSSNAGGATSRGSGPSRGFAVFLIMPGLWLYSVYPYHFSNPYRFFNESLRNETFPNGTNVSLPVTCLCQQYQVCGCDENDDQTYLKELVGNGSYAALNRSLVTVSEVNGTTTLVLNGSLPNGTTAPGGTDDDSAAVMLRFGRYGGYWVMGLIVVYTCAFM